MEQVKLDLDDLTKVYYSIGEVADMFNVNASLFVSGKKNLIL